ncbi:HlyD family efflux transporter periplasmic adaptor subunit [Rhodanobacter sp. AS-Z3]|uniref:efflux RND transporter periplasmic adaptor subunit n=1 Tax=Rhodanobacter sp. AS-Z3 TaxID=3031330 RepID=UPI00247AEECD|nr:HlyD family efflux transporter periplasmic adaptor subunit [Rhodanobacter sp. AS-Z3]WEN16536.1 HlyD family efflux transporter periplasmic adaptor subunit [Rhodanobacter sp. AS-Z3]
MKPSVFHSLRHVIQLDHCMALVMVVLLAGCSAGEAPKSDAAQPTAYAAVARGRIDIEGGLLNLTMAREGVLSTVAVHEGEHVSKGQLLATLDAEPAKLAQASAQAELEQARAQAGLLDIKLAAAKQRAQRLTAAAAAGAGDGQSADDAREAAALLDADRQTNRAAIDIASGKLDEARYEVKQRSLVAPFDAEVIHVSAQPGASISPSSGPLFVLLPNKPRIVRAELNESFVGTIHPGMPAEVVADSAGNPTPWPAHVLRVGQVYGPASLENDPQVRANARTVECVLAFDQPQSLRIGQRVIVRFGAGTTPTKAAPATAPAKD